jgi:type II secretory pathway component PulF
MPTYSYQLLAADGTRTKGTTEAFSTAEALSRVRTLGGTVLSLEAKKVRAGGGGFLKPKLSLKDKIIFTEQLAVMLNAGVTLLQALKGLEEEGTNKALNAILHDMIAQLEGGTPFSAALQRHTKTFSKIYAEMVKSAEKTGNLADILNKLTLQQQKEYELKGKVRGALMYPAIVAVLLVVVITMVITFIIPKLSGMFTESGTKLPGSTRFLLWLSSFLTHDWWLLILGIMAAIFGFRALVKTEKGRFWWDGFKMKIPVFGSFIKKSYMARFAQSFASLAQAGVPVLDVFQTLKGVVGNAVYEQEITMISRDVENGVKVSTAIRKSKHFPPMMGQLISVGEQSGDLAGIFQVLGEFFEKEVDGMAKNLSTLLEPIIMIVMGLGVGFVLISILQPIYGLVNTV